MSVFVVYNAQPLQFLMLVTIKLIWYDLNKCWTSIILYFFLCTFWFLSLFFLYSIAENSLPVALCWSDVFHPGTPLSSCETSSDHYVRSWWCPWPRWPHTQPQTGTQTWRYLASDNCWRWSWPVSSVAMMSGIKRGSSPTWLKQHACLINHSQSILKVAKMWSLNMLLTKKKLLRYNVSCLF